MKQTPRRHPRVRPALITLAVAASILGGSCSDGDDGAPGPPGPTVINLQDLNDEQIAALDVESRITSFQISPEGGRPSVTFRLETAGGTPILGLVPYWQESDRFVRFTIAKLVPGTPDDWVSYTRNGSGDPSYDTGRSLTSQGNGAYTFSFETNVSAVPGVTYQPGLTHRVAGQIGSGSVPLEAQNMFRDVVPTGAAMTTTRNIAVMESCNECHTDLVFHGRRFEVEYCVTCHNPDLAGGEGDMGYMIHRIHAAGDFTMLDGGISYAEVTYPQDLRNCRKCHEDGTIGADDADNWRTNPTTESCFGCHVPADHPGGQPPTNPEICIECHDSADIEASHLLPNATPHNPMLIAGQFEMAYELVSASVDMGTNEVTIEARITADGTPLDVANLPAELSGPGRYPGALLAWALPQDGITEPADYNNLGQRAGQPFSIGLDDFLAGGTAGTHSYDGGTGVNTFVVTDAARQFPMGSTLRAVGLQGYFQQDIGGDIVALHTPSAVVEVTGDEPRRMIVDNNKCANCHEWFEGHGGNRTLNMEICTLCHIPNLSSTGRTVTDPTARDLDDDLAAAVMAGTLDPSVDPNDPLTYPEDAQNFKDLVHALHASDLRETPFQHVRGPSRQGYYDWSEVTFPRGASTSDCTVCHLPGTFALPTDGDLLPTTVRTSGVADGQDPSVGAAEAAFVSLPNATDWVHSIQSGTCVGCHDSSAARAHMALNGGQLTIANFAMSWTNRVDLGVGAEACSICHGPGRSADVETVHQK